MRKIEIIDFIDDGADKADLSFGFRLLLFRHAYTHTHTCRKRLRHTHAPITHTTTLWVDAEAVAVPVKRSNTYRCTQCTEHAHTLRCQLTLKVSLNVFSSRAAHHIVNNVECAAHVCVAGYLLIIFHFISMECFVSVLYVCVSFTPLALVILNWRTSEQTSKQTSMQPVRPIVYYYDE